MGPIHDRTQGTLHFVKLSARNPCCSCTAIGQLLCSSDFACVSEIFQLALEFKVRRRGYRDTLTATDLISIQKGSKALKCHSPRSIGYTIVAPNAPATPENQSQQRITFSIRCTNLRGGNCMQSGQFGATRIQ